MSENVSYSVEGPIRGICKSHAIWANVGGESVPIVYLRKPKFVAHDLWEPIVRSIRLTVTRGELEALIEGAEG